MGKKLFVLLLAMLFSSCCMAAGTLNVSLPDSLVENREFIVTVKNSAGNPLQDANVSYAGESKFTDETGSAAFIAVKMKYVITVSKAGYDKVSFTRLVKQAGAPPAAPAISIEVLGDALTGRQFTVLVKNASGQPIKDANVSYGDQKQNTDTNGKARLTAKEGIRTITAVYAGNSATKTVSPRNPSDTNGSAAADQAGMNNLLSLVYQGVILLIALLVIAFAVYMYKKKMPAESQQIKIPQLKFVPAQWLAAFSKFWLQIKLQFGSVKTAKQLGEKIKALDLSYERVLYERIEGARNKALGLIILGILIVVFSIVLSDAFSGLDRIAGPAISRLSAGYESAKNSLLLQFAPLLKISDFFLGFGNSIKNSLYSVFKGTIVHSLYSFAAGLLALLFGLFLAALPVLLFFGILVYLNYREEMFWYGVMKEEKEEDKKKKVMKYLTQPFIALVAGYAIMAALLFLFSLLKCNQLACNANIFTPTLGATALQFFLLIGFYFAITGRRYVKKWLKAKELGLEEIRQSRAEMKEL